MGIFSLDVPDQLLKEFDNRIKGRYKTRAEAIRTAMSLLLIQINEDEKRISALKHLTEAQG